MATVDKNFKIKNGLSVGDSTNLVNYTSASPSDPFVGQLWINEPYLYAWSSASTWVLIGDGNTGGGGGSASGTPLNISNTLVTRSASGTFAIGAIDFDTTASPALSVGRMQWNQNFGTPEVGLIGGNVTANIGQHVHAYVTNDEGSSLVAGDVVYLFGAAGDRASVKKAYNLSDATSSKTFGVVAETIAAGQAGFVTVFGVVNKLDLSSYNPGDVLWLSASPGKFTSIKPSAPQHLVFVGVVEKTNAGNGQLFVNVQNGYELEELHSVQITNLTDNDILSYNGSSSLWFNQNLSTAIQEVDGAGSGIDADLLDGHQASYFINTSSATQEKLGNMTFHGTVNVEDIVITGSAITISSTNLALTDSLIQLAHEQYTTDAVDIGIVGSYGDETTSSAGHYHASFARDASQNKWKLLENGPAAVNNVIDYSDPSVVFGTLQVGAIEVSSSVTVSNLNSDLLDSQHGSYYLDWTNTTNKPDPIIGVELSGNTSGAASVTLTDLSSGQITITTNTTHATTASSINWSRVTDKPDPIIGVSLSGNTTGSASATLDDLANGQISITTNTAHAGTASSIAGLLVTGTVNNALHSNTASSIFGFSITGPVASANFAIFANSASSIAGSLVTGTVNNANHSNTASSINWSGITGLAQFPDGTAANPSITNTGDNNTGIFFPEEDTIAFSEGGTEVMRINAAAQVVIPGGTSASPSLAREGAPSTGIHFPDGAQIAFSTQGVQRWRISGNSFIGSSNTSFNPQIQLQNTNTDGNHGYFIFAKLPTDNSISSGDSLGNLLFQGIGTDGATKNSAFINVNADGPNTASNVPSRIIFGTSSGGTSAPERMRITSTGNVGIGTTNPNRTLSVIGTASFTGDVSAQTFSGLLLGNAMSASSINWSGITDVPDPIIGVSLQGQVTGAASATLTDFANGQISITTDTTTLAKISGTQFSASVSGVSPTGTATVSASTSPGGFRNIFFSTASAGTGGLGNDGDVWLVYV